MTCDCAYEFNLTTVAQMSNRVDALEAAIHDIISGDVTTPVASSPLASSGNGAR